MIMAGYEFIGEAPFSDVYIHGTVRDANGIKMSKSLGNGIDPLEIIDKYGADALRISLTLATPDGQDPWISKNTFEIGRNFVNKLHQVSRFLIMRLDDRQLDPDSFDNEDLVIFDRWILSRLERTIQMVDKAFEEYRLSAAAKTLYNFVWNDYCSWYVELIKPDKPGESVREGSLKVALYVLMRILRLLHPFVPFVTENIYRELIPRCKSDSSETISFGPWPETTGKHIDDKLEQSLEQIQAVVTAVRSVRAELNVHPGKRSDLYIKVDSSAFKALLENHIDYFRSLIRVDTLHVGADVKKPPTSASTIISGAEIFIPLEGLIDVEVEKKRLEKELDNLKSHLIKLSKKLANADFLANAPKEVIDREKTKKEDYQERIEKLNKNLEQIMGW
jgi:valyl-tRNA synthetase